MLLTYVSWWCGVFLRHVLTGFVTMHSVRYFGSFAVTIGSGRCVHSTTFCLDCIPDVTTGSG